MAVLLPVCRAFKSSQKVGRQTFSATLRGPETAPSLLLASLKCVSPWAGSRSVSGGPRSRGVGPGAA